jgi:hypothetical protein
VYEAPLPLKLLTVPLLTATSAAVKPVTGSLKVTLTGIGDWAVTSAAGEDRVTVGATPSYVRLNTPLAALPLPEASSAAPAATYTEKGPWALGVKVKAYEPPLPLKPLTEALTGTLLRDVKSLSV